MELFKDKEEIKDCQLDMGRGCEFCSCGEGGETCAKVSEGCFKLHVTDWLKDYPDNLPDDIYEVRFKNTRRGYYQNVNELPLKVGDIIAVEASPGHDIGIISLTGDMVARQMRRVGFNPQNGEFKKIYRKAKPYDIEKWQEAIALEHTTMIKARQIAADMNLNMKIGDVEYQGDKIKAIFYYIADERVDFRELIKVFADMFHVRVEMKQIGARQEAGRIGGLGACGRELCCASWISSFLSVTTNAARTQDISLNPQKLAGQCSKLKCCLIYEYDDYMDARKEFPRVNEPLRTIDGEYFLIKTDILARTMSFSTAPGSMANLTTLHIDRVREIQRMNAKGAKPDKLENISEPIQRDMEPNFVNAIGEDSITRFDAARSKNKKTRGGRERENRNGDQQRSSQENRRNDSRRDSKPTDNNANETEIGDKTDRQSRSNTPQRDNNRKQASSNPPRERREGDRPQQREGGRPTRQNKQQPRKDASSQQIGKEQSPARDERKESDTANNPQAQPVRQGNNFRGNRNKPQSRRSSEGQGQRRDNRTKGTNPNGDKPTDKGGNTSEQ